MASLSCLSGLSSSLFLAVFTAWVLGTGKQDLYCTGKALSVQKRRQARGGISSATQTGEGLADHVTSPALTYQQYIQTHKKHTAYMSPSLHELNSQRARLSVSVHHRAAPLKRTQAKQTQACIKDSRKPQPTLLLSFIPCVTPLHADPAPQIHTLQ